MLKRLSFCCAVMLLCWSTAHAQQKSCPDAVARQAEAEAGTQHTWAALLQYYHQFGSCFGPKVDDADAEEGTSDAIQHLLADHWNTLPQLRQIIRKHPGFGDFVGLDATMNADAVAKIKSDATHRCPRGMHKFCKKLIWQANEAATESKEVR
jgi:hypothetical protein